MKAVGQGFPPLFTVQMHEDGETQTLTIDSERYVTNAEVSAFLNEFSRHPFVLKQCSLTSHPKHKAARGKLLVGIQITFYPNILKIEDMPDFVRSFLGFIEGKIPKPRKRLTVWDRIRHPLV